MITPKQLFKLMRESGVVYCEVGDKDGASIKVQMASPRTGAGIPVITETSEELDNSAAMPEYDGGSYRGRTVYDDPDLYPDGIDPVAELRKQHGLHPNESE